MNKLYEKLRKEKHVKYLNKWIKNISYIMENILEEKPRRFWERKELFSVGTKYYYIITFLNNSTIIIYDLKKEDFEIFTEGEIIPNGIDYIHYKINQLKGYDCDYNKGLIEAYKDVLKRL